MRRRVLVASVAAVLSLASCSLQFPDIDRPAQPACNVLLGVAANPLPHQDWDTALTDFEAASGRNMDLVRYYKRGQGKLFPDEIELARSSEPGLQRILFYNWKPDGLTWREVADGDADHYLVPVARRLAAHEDQPFFLSLNAEMEDEVDMDPESGQTADDFRRFFRHVVSTLRSNGADNVVTVMNYTGAEKWALKDWFGDLYPGDDVVDWVAQDPYAYAESGTTDLAGLVNRSSGGAWPGFYNWAAEHYPDKPQMLAEWGVAADLPPAGAKADFFRTAADDLAELPKLRALVYWNHSGPDQADHLAVGDTSIDSHPDDLAAFREFINEDVLNSPSACRLAHD